jgi:hypothetical protein
MIEAKDLILKEIEIVHSEIARFDNNGLKVKEWCLGVWAALLAYGIQHRELLIVAAAFITTISFSLVELTYRRFQSRFFSRSRRLEEMLTSEDQAKKYKFDIHFSAVGERDPSTFWDELSKVLRQQHFTYFYLILAAFAYACMVYVYVLHSVIDDSAVNEWVIRVLVALIVGGMLSLIVGFVRSEIAKNQSK